MNQMAGIKMTHAAYRGGAPAMNDLLAGQVSLMFLTTVQSLPFLKDKRLKALAVSSAQRAAVLPDVPTVAGNHSRLRLGCVVRGDRATRYSPAYRG